MEKIYKWVSRNRRLLNGLSLGISIFLLFVLSFLKVYTIGIGVLWVLFVAFVSREKTCKNGWQQTV